MSFGVGVDDIIAVVRFLERIGREFQNYRNAPLHIRQVGAEPHLSHRAVIRLLEIEAHDEEEKEWLEQVRAIALQCHQPLRASIEKTTSKEYGGGLKNGRLFMALTTLGRRLYWPLIANKGVEELRRAITAGITAINMMLGIQ